MKCPSCGNMHNINTGMICIRCRYKFVFNPDEKPYISDSLVADVIVKLSNEDQFYFTRNQLYFALRKKLRPLQNTGCAVFFISFLFLIVGLLSSGGISELLLWIGAAGIIFSVIQFLLTNSKKRRLTASETWEVIERYTQMYPPKKMTDGTKWLKIHTQGGFTNELLDYIPKAILIVPRCDIAEMLILNDFHSQYNTLVISLNGYPDAELARIKKLLETHPHTPVFLFRDNHMTVSSSLRQIEQIGLHIMAVLDLGWNLSYSDVTHLISDATDASMPADFYNPKYLMNLLSFAILHKMPLEKALVKI